VRELLSRGSFKNLDKLIDSDDLISGDKFLEFSKNCPQVAYYKTDFIYRGGVWRGEKQKSLISNVNELTDKILILGHSDLPISRASAMFLVHVCGAKKIYGTNLRQVQGVSQLLPLGLTNDSGESEFHDIFGNTEHFLHANKIAGSIRTQFDLSIYANFTVQNNSRVRGLVSSLIPQMPKSYRLKVESPSMSNEGRVNYLANLRRTNFVLCPEGNGMDTHRLWETLYMGGVPVVVKSRYLDPIYFQLPLVRLESWRDLLNPEILERKWSEVQQFEWNESILSQTYWLNEISEDLKIA
jgi:hypothetical protein